MHILPPLNCRDNSLARCSYLCASVFWTLCSVFLIDLSIHALMAHGLNYCSCSFINSLFTYFLLLNHTACGILVPQPGIEPVSSAVKEQCPKHWTTWEFPPLTESQYGESIKSSSGISDKSDTFYRNLGSR